MVDAHKNFAVSLVATAPSPASSGTSLGVTAGEGSRFPAVPFNATVGPANTLLTPSNSEIVRVTARATDTLTITRAQESTSARTIVVGDQIAATITAKALTDVEGDVTAAIATAAAADATHAAHSDPHAGYRLESADHTHASTGLQAGQVAGSNLSGTPGGELGGTWGSPTVDATHSGSIHQATATFLIAASNALASTIARADYVCTGTADDVKINAAVQALPAGGGKIVLSEGDFFIDATINIDRNSTTLMGAGVAPKSNQSGQGTITGGSRLQSTSSHNSGPVLNIVSDGSPVPTTAGLHGITLRDFTVDMENAGASATEGILMFTVRSRVDNVHVYNAVTHGIRLYGLVTWNSYDNFFTGVVCMTCGGAGMYIGIAGVLSPTYSGDGHISHCIFALNHNGLVVSGSSWQITGVHCYDNDQDGIQFLVSGTRTKAVGCKIEGNGAFGINVQGNTSSAPSELQIIGCEFSQNGVHYGPNSSVATTISVTGATNATPIVVTTSSAHGLTSGDHMGIFGVGGNTAANGTFLVTVLSTTTFSLQDAGGTDVAGTGAYTSGGEIQGDDIILWGKTAGISRNRISTCIFAIKSGATIFPRYAIHIPQTLVQSTRISDCSFSQATSAAGPWNYDGGIPVKDASSSPLFTRIDGTHRLPEPGNAGVLDTWGNGSVSLVSAGAETRTLAAPQIPGLEILLFCKTYVGNIVVTVATAINAAGNTIITFTATGQYIRLVSVENGSVRAWRVAGSDGVALS